MSLPIPPTDTAIHLVGIKGTGMSGLAELLLARGARVTGSDTGERFYTDAVLERLSLEVIQGFASDNVPSVCDLVVYSAAYDPQTHPELVEARRRGIPTIRYTQALGDLSRVADTTAIAGVHGKTTTTALVGALARTLHLDATVVAGSAVDSFGGGSVLVHGERFLFVEACEYRRNFLDIAARRAVVTAVEPDHQDYYPTADAMDRGFQELVAALPTGGSLITCADDPGAARLADWAVANRGDLHRVRYGVSADGPFAIDRPQTIDGRVRWRIFAAGNDPFELRVPGEHNGSNATAAVAAVVCAVLGDGAGDTEVEEFLRDRGAEIREAIASFRGSRRRCEVIGTAGDVLFVDDYAHHPTALRTTIHGLRRFYPGRRLLLSFMPHTYSRTAAMAEEFAEAFDEVDVLITHDIYASARETPIDGVTGEAFADRIRSRRLDSHRDGVHYFAAPEAAVDFCMDSLRPGDLFVTMGAGDNWKLGRSVLSRLAGGRPATEEALR